ncbi:MAG TPA: hypothetical protein VJX67_16065 [Blastocatellia bacterium]|nr:hypothetical protein [Blastocatellia bacterium]
MTSISNASSVMNQPRRHGRPWNPLYVSLAAVIATVIAGELLQFFVYRNHVRFAGGTDFLLYAGQSEAILRGQPPDIIWKPFGGGAWLAMYRLLFGDNMAGFAVFNSAALGLLPFFAFGFGALLRGMRSGLACAAIVAISPACATLSVLAETPAIFFLALSLVTIALIQKLDRWWLASLVAALGALFLAAACLCRPDCAVYALAALVLTVRPGRAALARFAGSFAFVAAAGVLVLATSWYNKPFYGRGLPVRYDSYLRYILVFDTGKDYRVNPTEPAIQEIRASLLKTGAAAEEDLTGTGFLGWNRGWWYFRQSLKTTKGSYYEADRIMSQASVAVIRNNLAGFTEDAARTFASFMLFRPIPGAYTFAHFESKPGFQWRRLDFVQADQPEIAAAANRLYQSIRDAREDRPYNNWSNPYNSRYLRLLTFAPLLIYPAVAWLVWTAAGLARWRILAVLASPLLAYGAYATTGFYDYRYLAGHSWALWTIAGMGLAAAAESLVIRASRRLTAKPVTTGEPSHP